MTTIDSGTGITDIAAIVRPDEAKMIINGQLADASNGETFPVYDPATNNVLAHVPKGTIEDVDRAVASAQAAYESVEWQKMSANKRGRLLHGLAALVRRDQERLATIEMRTRGKRGHRRSGMWMIAPRRLSIILDFRLRYMGRVARLLTSTWGIRCASRWGRVL